ncbi:uncharacterized protein [Montipora foliosa]|uniref:uncharacterized protein n=1 Tax=Montipora foliosa TaxID=591990 RepID=UPI0035F14731
MDAIMKRKWHKAKIAESEKSQQGNSDINGEDVYAAAFMVFVGNIKSVDKECYPWLIDSGASSHMTKEKHVLTNFQEFEEPENVALGDGRVVKALGSGRVQMNMLFPGTDAKKAVLYIWYASVAQSRSDLWHQHLGHVHESRLKKCVQNEFVQGIDTERITELSFCEGCLAGKMCRKPFPIVGGIRSMRKLQLVHSDVCGPMQTQAIGGAKYFVTFIDDYTRCCAVHFMKHK